MVVDEPQLREGSFTQGNLVEFPGSNTENKQVIAAVPTVHGDQSKDTAVRSVNSATRSVEELQVLRDELQRMNDSLHKMEAELQAMKSIAQAASTDSQTKRNAAANEFDDFLGRDDFGSASHWIATTAGQFKGVDPEPCAPCKVPVMM